MKSRNFSTRGLVVAFAAPCLLSATAIATPIGIVDWPLSSGTSVQIKPNLLFILDDSGSMDSNYLPDNSSASGSNCFRNTAYNYIAYDPTQVYKPPVDYLGNSYPNASFVAAWNDGYHTSWGTTDLTGAYYTKYTASSPSTPVPGTCYTNASYTKKPILSGEQQNYANWYSYYRTRMLMMKTAVGHAFKDIDQDFRVGLTVISKGSTATGGVADLAIKDFEPTHKSNWFARFYSVQPYSWTPLRGALSKAGRIYANKWSGFPDPVQYSCQQNFTILSTDGYWNSNIESATYGPKNLSGADVGNQDGSLPTPMKDGLNKSNTLADVAAYYYNTDLRSSALGNCTGAPVGSSSGDVCGTPAKNPKQSMVTYTIGLGLSGKLAYTDTYTTGGSPDFELIKSGAKNWPDPIANTQSERIDDLWHAAVNGGGVYYSAKNAASLATSLRSALVGVAAASGSGGTPATSSLDPTLGDDKMFVPSYTSKRWDGDVSAYKIDLATGALLPGKLWSAQAKVDSAGTRNILVASGSALVAFSTANLSSAIAAKYFDVGPTNPNGQLSQYATLSSASKAIATPGSVIDFLKGNSTYEDKDGNAVDNRIYRPREHKLGDIVNSSPKYVKKPQFDYIDGGYSAFVTAKASRQGVVYAGANDGMLHAFNADTGDELWAFVPQAVIPNMYKLADKNYPNNHKYYVDGSISVGDVCLLSACGASDWKTILVGGLNKGGRGIFALDVTDPATPKLMWEIASTSPSFANLGFTFGKPLIAKRKNGSVWEWVVVFASGYDNESPGDGKGHVYVVKAADGALVGDMTTGISDASKSGIARLSGWADDATTNNAVRYVYGGDLSGNLWRFDIETMSAAKLAVFNNGGPQPITAAPELGEVLKQGVKYRVIFAGTGKYLGLSDITDASPQTMYAVKDTLSSTWSGSFRSVSGVVNQTLSTSGSTRTVTSNPVNWSSSPGWYIDLPISKERMNVDPVLWQGTLVFVTNIPSNDACSVGGSSWMQFVDFATGGMVPGASSAGAFLGDELGTSPAIYNLPKQGESQGGPVGKANSTIVPIPKNPDNQPTRRSHWRELVD